MRNHAEEGVSLIELLVALTILGIVMAGVTATVASSLRVTSESTAVTAASGLATSSMEELKTICKHKCPHIGCKKVFANEHGLK